LVFKVQPVAGPLPSVKYAAAGSLHAKITDSFDRLTSREGDSLSPRSEQPGGTARMSATDIA